VHLLAVVKHLHQDARCNDKDCSWVFDERCVGRE